MLYKYTVYALTSKLQEMVNFIYYVIVLGYVSRVTSLDYEKETRIYNEVSVIFSDDICNETASEMPDFSSPGRRISEIKCLEYTWMLRKQQMLSSRSSQCEDAKQRWHFLIGGFNAVKGEYPHMGALGWKAKIGTWIFKCGGSLISEKFVVTAAHCSKVPSTDKTVIDLHPKIVRLGSTRILDSPNAFDARILKFISHHRYKAPRQYYDIALIELENTVTFKWEVHPACLWTKFENPDTGTLTGWGIVDSGTRELSPVLQEAEITIIDYDECNETLKMKRYRNWGGFLRHQLCAGEKAGGIDTCEGDSGGPLQKQIPLYDSPLWEYWYQYHIIGITSFGFGCAKPNTPSIYTRIASFLGWIENIVWKDTTAIDDRYVFTT